MTLDKAKIIERIAAGESPDALVAELVAAGHDEDAAVTLLTEVLQSRLAELQAPKTGTTPSGTGADAIASQVPDPLDADWPAILQRPERALKDQTIEVQLALTRPRLVLFRNFLSHQECDSLIRLARDRIEASEVIDMQSGSTRHDQGRTSSGMNFQRAETPLIERIEKRISALLRWPYEKGEALQVLRYRVGQEYQPHFDYVDPTQPGAGPFLARGGQRVATFLMYLNTPEDGGGTNFPDAGLEIAAHKGSALFFSYDRPDPNTLTRHGGMPVRAGEKWVATKWLREAEHR
jgi:prolyl 4-hydroxylase